MMLSTRRCTVHQPPVAAREQQMSTLARAVISQMHLREVQHVQATATHYASRRQANAHRPAPCVRPRTYS
jgi:hypothetical protein